MVGGHFWKIKWNSFKYAVADLEHFKFKSRKKLYALHSKGCGFHSRTHKCCFYIQINSSWCIRKKSAFVFYLKGIENVPNLKSCRIGIFSCEALGGQTTQNSQITRVIWYGQKLRNDSGFRRLWSQRMNNFINYLSTFHLDISWMVLSH